MSPKKTSVDRPIKKSEYRLEFHTREAAKGWTDLLATLRNATVDAWNQLTTAPTTVGRRQYPLKADYAHVDWQGATHERWQYKVSDGARIWYFVTEDPTGKCAGVVRLERCLTGHPGETTPAASAG